MFSLRVFPVSTSPTPSPVDGLDVVSQATAGCQGVGVGWRFVGRGGRVSMDNLLRIESPEEIPALQHSSGQPD